MLADRITVFAYKNEADDRYDVEDENEDFNLNAYRTVI